MSSDSFLSRWSRRKQAVRTGESSPEDTVPPAEPGAPDRDAQAPAPDDVRGGVAPSEAELSAEEIAALPSVEDLTAETDISMFLRKGVPEPLRNAALRRMWSLDPKIRDFVCEAREYAYDWNTPGGVPGSGALPASEETLRLAARIVGGEPSEPAPTTGGEGEAGVGPSHDREPPALAEDASGPAEPPQGPAVSSPPEGQHRSADGADHAPSPSTGFVESTRPPADTQPRGADKQAGVAATRRHGGAMPL